MVEIAPATERQTRILGDLRNSVVWSKAIRSNLNQGGPFNIEVKVPKQKKTT